jgi:hypothetical protein
MLKCYAKFIVYVLNMGGTMRCLATMHIPSATQRDEDVQGNARHFATLDGTDYGPTELEQPLSACRHC